MVAKSEEFVGPLMPFRQALRSIIVAIIVVVLWIPYLYSQAAQILLVQVFCKYAPCIQTQEIDYAALPNQFE